jgi:hypothetical protein
MTTDHLENKYQHLKNRMWQRFGIILTDDDHAELKRRIQTQEATFVNRISRNVTRWKTRFKSKDMFLLYTRKWSIVLTAYKYKYKSQKRYNRQQISSPYRRGELHEREVI